MLKGVINVHCRFLAVSVQHWVPDGIWGLPIGVRFAKVQQPCSQWKSTWGVSGDGKISGKSVTPLLAQAFAQGRAESFGSPRLAVWFKQGTMCKTVSFAASALPLGSVYQASVLIWDYQEILILQTSQESRAFLAYSVYQSVWFLIALTQPWQEV